jgi:hypothetical protein
MMNPFELAVLPVGEFESDIIRHEVGSIFRALNELGAHLSIAEVVLTEEDARQSVQELLDKKPNLLLLIPLRGLSAPIMEAAAQMVHLPCLIWPVQGSYALQQHSGVGALREAGQPVELFYAPPDDPAHQKFSDRS